MNNIEYESLPDGCGFCAKFNGKNIGEITFIKIGLDKLMIDHTFIDVAYQRLPIEFRLVSMVVNLAREQHRKILSICPSILNVFAGHPEFDDVRLMNLR
jgi:hypothetical protein